MVSLFGALILSQGIETCEQSVAMIEILAIMELVRHSLQRSESSVWVGLDEFIFPHH